MEKYYSVSELSEIFGIDQIAIRRKLKTNEITGHKLGKEWRVSQTQLDEYLDRTRNVSGTEAK